MGILHYSGIRILKEKENEIRQSYAIHLPNFLAALDQDIGWTSLVPLGSEN